MAAATVGRLARCLFREQPRWPQEGTRSFSSSSRADSESGQQSRNKYKQTRSERFFEEGRYTFTEVIWDHKLLFCCIPVVMMLARGGQENMWPESSAVVLEADADNRKITYRYYCGNKIIEHTQERNSIMSSLEQWIYGSWKDEDIKRGDRIVVNLNPKRPECSVFRPLPIAVWHIGLTKQIHPQKGRFVNDELTEQPTDVETVSA